MRRPVVHISEPPEEEITRGATQKFGSLISVQRPRSCIAVETHDDPRPGHDHVTVLTDIGVGTGVQRLEHRRQPVSTR